MSTVFPRIDFWSLPATSLVPKPFVIWFSGLPSSGKTSLATALLQKFNERGFLMRHLDGDMLREGLNAGLGFSIEGREENLRRAAEASKLFTQIGVGVIGSFITPLETQREMVRAIAGKEVPFFLIGLECSRETCALRDVKGYYAKAKNGEMPNFTGLDAPFEDYLTADLLVNTEENDLETCLNEIIQFLNTQLDT